VRAFAGAEVVRAGAGPEVVRAGAGSEVVGDLFKYHDIYNKKNTLVSSSDQFKLFIIFLRT